MLPGATGLILCSPCNPTGAVYTHAEIRAIAQWAKAKKVWVIADEIYRRIHYARGRRRHSSTSRRICSNACAHHGRQQDVRDDGMAHRLRARAAKIAKAMAALQSHTTRARITRPSSRRRRPRR